MDEIIDILQQEMALLQALEQILEREAKSLASASAGVEAAKYAGEIDGVLRRFRRMRAAEVALCTRLGASSIEEAIDKVPDLTKAQEAHRLWAALQKQLEVVRLRGAHNRALIERIMLYTEFNVNVMRRATAEGTYAKEATEASGTKPTVESRKLFDTGI